MYETVVKENGDVLKLNKYVLKTYGSIGMLKELHSDNLDEITDYLEMIVVLKDYPFVFDEIYSTEFTEEADEFADYRAKLDDCNVDEAGIVSYQLFELFDCGYKQISFTTGIMYDEKLLNLARRKL